MPVPVLFCADPLNPRRVDDHFAAQADAVRAAGGTVGLIDHDALTRGDADAAVRRLPSGLGPVWYRGWMVDADLARRTDGTWRVVEVGDGQVSDLPGTVDPYPLMDRLSSCAAR